MRMRIIALCYSCCFVFCALVGAAGLRHFASVVAVFFQKFPGSTVPTLDFSHKPAWNNPCQFIFFCSLHWWGGGMGGMLRMLMLFLLDVDCLYLR